MNTDVKNIIPFLLGIIGWFRRHIVVICILVVALMYGGLIVQINLLNRRQPTQDEVNEKLRTVKQLRVDEATVNKLKKLEDNSSEVVTIQSSQGKSIPRIRIVSGILE